MWALDHLRLCAGAMRAHSGEEDEASSAPACPQDLPQPHSARRGGSEDLRGFSPQ